MPSDHEKLNDIKPIQELYKVWGLMRLDWFGGVSWNSGDESNPLLHLFLSPGRFRPSLSDPRKKEWVSDVKKQVHVSIGVGYLPYLSLGQMFFKGRHAPLYRWPDSETILFELDTSEQDSVIDHHLYDRVEGNNYWISHTPVGKDNWDAAKKSRYKILKGYYLEPRQDGNGFERIFCEVIVHEIEIIRYYYTNSSRLCKAVFMGEFEEDRLTKGVVSTLHKEYSFDEQTGTGSFIYQHGFIMEDAPIIGRILFSPNKLAFKGVLSASNSIRQSRLNNDGIDPGYPHTIFPFFGKTKMTLSGRRIKSLDGTERFLTYCINDCTHPFPYRRLEYRDAIDPRGEKAPEDAETMFEGYGGAKNKASDGNKGESDLGTCISDEQPSALEMGLHVELAHREYSGLKGVELKLMDPEKCTHRSGFHSGAEQEALINASTGDASYAASSAKPLSIHHRIVRKSTVSRNLQTFVEAIKSIRKLRPEWYISKLALGRQALEEGESYSCFPILRSKYRPSIILQFSFHDKEKELRRRFICYEIRVSGRFGYLFEAESRVRVSKDGQPSSKDEMSILFLRRPGFEQCLETDFVGFLRDTVSFGGWCSKNSSNDFVRHYTVHGAGAQSVDDISVRIIHLIERGLDLDRLVG